MPFYFSFLILLLFGLQASANTSRSMDGTWQTPCFNGRLFNGDYPKVEIASNITITISGSSYTETQSLYLGRHCQSSRMFEEKTTQASMTFAPAPGNDPTLFHLDRENIVVSLAYDIALVKERCNRSPSTTKDCDAEIETMKSGVEIFGGSESNGILSFSLKMKDPLLSEVKFLDHFAIPAIQFGDAKVKSIGRPKVNQGSMTFYHVP